MWLPRGSHTLSRGGVHGVHSFPTPNPNSLLAFPARNDQYFFFSRQGSCRGRIGDGVSRIAGQFGAALGSRHDPGNTKKNMEASDSSTWHVGACPLQSHRSSNQVAGSPLLIQAKR